MANVSRIAVIGNKARITAWLVAVFLALAMFTDMPSMQAFASLRPDEATIKAAYLYKFGNFIEWPEHAFSGSGAFTIGVIGADPVADELERLVDGRIINNRPVAVRRLQADERLADVNILFIGRSRNRQLGEILAAAKGESVLTVTEAEQGLAFGSMINFVVVGGKLRFDVAPKTAGLGKLVISARLLAAAHRVDVEAGT